MRRRAAGACDIAAVVFDAERRELFRTSGAMQLSGNWGLRMSKGVLYGVGTGPGDPELLTIKAVRTIESCPVIAAPQTADGAMVALDIVRGAVDLTSKTVIPVRFSMTRDAERRTAEHASLVRELVAHLDAVRDVALLNLGDPSIYATFQRIAPDVRARGFQRIAPDVRARGFEARAIPGVPSFCAVAAALERDLTPELLRGRRGARARPHARDVVASAHRARRLRRRAPRNQLAGDEGGHEGAPLACGHEVHPSRGGRLRRCRARRGLWASGRARVPLGRRCARSGQLLLDDGGALDEGFLHSVH